MQNQLVKTEEIIYPNIDKGWSFWSFWSVKSPIQALKGQEVGLHKFVIKYFPVEIGCSILSRVLGTSTKGGGHQILRGHRAPKLTNLKIDIM